jgi:hypothetical protein
MVASWPSGRPSRAGSSTTNVAVEQANTQLALDGLDAAAEGWLAQVGGFGGAGEMQSVGKGDDVVQAAQIHGIAFHASKQ